MPEVIETTAGLNAAQEILKSWIVLASTPEPERLDLVINPKDLLPAVSALLSARWGYLAAITGVDYPGANLEILPSDEERKWGRLGSIALQQSRFFQEGHLEILYHFCYGAAVTTLRVRVPYSAPVVSSICGLIPSATLYERELIEMLGIQVQDTPNTDRLILPDDWPEDVYPLRKSFHGFDDQAEER